MLALEWSLFLAHVSPLHGHGVGEGDGEGISGLNDVPGSGCLKNTGALCT